MTEDRYKELGNLRARIRHMEQDEHLLKNLRSKHDLQQALSDGLEIPQPILERFVAELLTRNQVDRLRLEDEWGKA